MNRWILSSPYRISPSLVVWSPQQTGRLTSCINSQAGESPWTSLSSETLHEKNPLIFIIGTSRRQLGAVAILAILAIARPAAQAASSSGCESLAGQKLPNTTITAAQAITTGSFTPPGSTNPITNLPPFCRVAGVMAPTSESQIVFEVWLPLEKWNGKFAGVGNGGWAGMISYGPLAEQLRRGYATASTNTGHEAAGGVSAARFAFEKPEQLIDFAYRSHHETALKAKAITEAFYAKPPQHAYFIGCSSGGYEGLMEAQRFPGDYDGIVSGMPANNWTRLMAGDFDATLATFKGGVNNLPPSALGTIGHSISNATESLERPAEVRTLLGNETRFCGPESRFKEPLF